MTEAIAAAIGYTDTPAPVGLPAGFAAPPGAALRFLSIRALDGQHIPAALWQPGGRAPADTTLVVMVHGVGDSLATSPSDIVGRGLAAGGRAVLAISTRQSGAAMGTDSFLDTRRDLEAAVAVGRALGYGRLVMAGHSLGNIQVLFHAATDWSAGIAAVALLGPFADLPWKTRHVLVADEDSYRALGLEARAALCAGTPEAVLERRMGFYTGGGLAVTARHFLTYREQGVSVADGTFWIRRLPCPVLIIRDAADALVAPFEAQQLHAAATAPGALPPSARLQTLPNPAPPSLEAHRFTGTAEALVAALEDWLAELRM